ncbi:MAG: hypothetical protein HN341_00100, partial [Verrucomicrobia bacterium]|nr:hypothetical protein [Verrucomicrobiota bacterium]
MRTKYIHWLAVVSLSLCAAHTALAATQHMGDGSDKPITATGSRNWDTSSTFWRPVNDGSASYTIWTNGNDAAFYGGSMTITATEDISVGNIHWSGASGGLTLSSSGGKITIDGAVTTDNPQWFKFDGSVAGTVSISDVLYFQFTGGVAFDSGTVITVDDPGSLAR